MKTFAYQICEYLASSSDRFSFGSGNTNLKVSKLNPSQNGVFVRSNPSIEPDRYTGIEYHSLDFVALNKSYAVAAEDLQEIYKIFDRNVAYETDDYHIYYSHAQGQFSDLGRDVEDRQILRLSILFITRYLILIS